MVAAQIFETITDMPIDEQLKLLTLLFLTCAFGLAYFEKNEEYYVKGFLVWIVLFFVLTVVLLFLCVYQRKKKTISDNFHKFDLANCIGGTVIFISCSSFIFKISGGFGKLAALFGYLAAIAYCIDAILKCVQKKHPETTTPNGRV